MRYVSSPKNINEKINRSSSIVDLNNEESYLLTSQQNGDDRDWGQSGGDLDIYDVLLSNRDKIKEKI